jgi:thiol-disulfide isomerase/thioredoxin
VAAPAALTPEVRALIARNEFAAAQEKLRAYRRAAGVTAEWLAANSWLGRGLLAARQYEQAEAVAAETERLIGEYRQKNPRTDFDREIALPLGAAIEVQSQALAAKGGRSAAVSLLNQRLAVYGGTSIAARLRKNLNLLTLEGRSAPALDFAVTLGAKPPASLAALRGRPVLLFFWAHWCSDCKDQAPVLERIVSEFGKSKGLVLIGPTQRYGYTAGGEDASPAQELKYIDEVRQKFYARLSAVMPSPVSERIFTLYGASTTPTLVLIDRGGVVRLYRPGNMTYEELAGRIRALP